VETTTILALAPSAAASALYTLEQGIFLVALRRARGRRASAASCARAPGVSVLKPLAGADDDLDENLASFAALDYPAYEVLFGVASPRDPALDAARRFVARHPKVRARIVITDPEAAHNPKVAQLVGLEAQAAGEIVVISDSNVRVPRDYLWSLVRELEDPSVGLVTSIFAGTGERTLGAALENLQLGAVIAPGVVAYATLSSRPLTVGKSMAMRRRDLAVLGGLRRVGGVLAEDHALGRMFLDAGFETRTAMTAVENRNVDAGIMRTVERHSRWAKMRRAIHPVAFLFEPLLSPVAVTTAALVVNPARALGGALLAAMLLQIALGQLALRALRGRALPWYYAPLDVMRAYVALACWVRALVSRRVTWRGHAFILGPGSELVPADAHARDRASVARA
jgi:ceramide glucosyltransferase